MVGVVCPEEEGVEPFRVVPRSGPKIRGDGNLGFRPLVVVATSFRGLLFGGLFLGALVEMAWLIGCPSLSGGEFEGSGEG